MTDAPQLLLIGRVLKPWGFHGELKIQILTDFPDRFASLREVFVGDDAKSFSVERTHRHGKFILLKLGGIESERDAEGLRDQFIRVPVTDAVPLQPNQVYLYQLIGMQVVTTEGKPIGEIVDILDTNANDVYVVRDGVREFLLPGTIEVVREIDLARKLVTVQLIDGLLD